MDQVEQRRGLLSERPLAGGPSRSHEGPSEEDPGVAPWDRTRDASSAYWLGIVQSAGTMWIQV